MKTLAFAREELAYCLSLVSTHGDDKVGHDAKTIATYLRLQASSAYRAGYLSTAAHLGAAATAINEDARNSHTPRWVDATMILVVASDDIALS